MLCTARRAVQVQKAAFLSTQVPQWNQRLAAGSPGPRRRHFGGRHAVSASAMLT